MNNNNLTYILFVFIILVLLYLYQRFQQKLDRENNNVNYNIIQKYLLSESDNYKLSKSSKPILWLYIDYDYNSRKWLSFGSRSSFELNQPYLYLTVKSIIEKCDNSFHICLIDDKSFTKLLPNWNVDLTRISDPVKKYMIELAMTKLLYQYGGIRVPISFVCMKDLISLTETPFVCEFVNRNISSTYTDFYPSIEFMGSNKENPIIKDLINYIEIEISQDYTDETKFLGSFDRWCKKQGELNKIKIIDGQFIGTKTMKNQQILIDNLLTNDYIDINSNTYGIYIPQRELMMRNHYNWFLRMSPKQVLQGNMILSKYILLSNTPNTPSGIIEPLQSKPDWISFWKVPSAAPVWGLKPVMLGNYVGKQSFPANIPGP
jgi:hypothetical protein